MQNGPRSAKFPRRPDSSVSMTGPQGAIPHTFATRCPASARVDREQH
jgi:hypothetical protein